MNGSRPSPVGRRRSGLRWRLAAAIVASAALLGGTWGAEAGVPDPAAQLPTLTEPVNDFAHVVDGSSAAAMDQMIRQLKAATGDVVIVVTVPTFEPFGDIREYANRLFENHGRGVGEKGKDNGLLIVTALKERRVWIEVGYGLEPFITDGFAGETTRDVILPQFRNGRYGAGLAAGTERIIARIAEARHVTLQGVRAERRRPPTSSPTPAWVVILIFVAVMVLSRIGGGPGSGRRFYRGGWMSGIGSFGGGFGGFGGGFGGGGGGFGGFGGGGSGGGGGGGGW